MKIKTKRGARRIRNQRVITRRFVTTDYTGCPYITAGKRYELREEFIESDCDTSIYIIRPDSPVDYCNHLDNVGKWRYATI